MKRLLLLLALQSTALVAMAEEPAKHLFYEDFAAEENFTNNWVVLDNNNDKSHFSELLISKKYGGW